MSEAIAARDPSIFCVYGVKEGDAFKLATRFDRGYVYRGGCALFWNGAFTAREIFDAYLPVEPLRPLVRRGLLRVEGDYEGRALTLVAAHFAEDRLARSEDLRYVRDFMRNIEPPWLLFAREGTLYSRTTA